MKDIYFLLFVGILFLGLGACTNTPGDSSERGPMGPALSIIPSVEVVQARVGSLPLEERLSGIVRATNQVMLYAEISAPVVRIAVQNGDYVRQGDPLVYLRDKQYQDQLRQADAALLISQADAKGSEATLNQLQMQLARVQQLVDKQLQSQQELETLQARVASAEAALEQAQARIAQAAANVEEQREALRRTVVRAPISGYVGQRNAEVGMRVDPGVALFTIGNFDQVRVEVAITDRMINKIQTGQTALISLEEADSLLIEAKVSRISPFLEAGSYSAAAEIDVSNKNGRLHPGMFVAVDVLYGESEQAVLVPESALYENPNTGMLGVYVAPSLRSETPIREPEVFDENNPPPLTEPTPMVFKPVDVRARGRGVAGITGIQFGDWVITVGQNMIRPIAGKIEARARPMSWDRIALLQDLQDQDLLHQFMNKQQRMAREVFQADNVQSETAQPDTARPQAIPASTSNAAQ